METIPGCVGLEAFVQLDHSPDPLEGCQAVEPQALKPSLLIVPFVRTG